MTNIPEFSRIAPDVKLGKEVQIHAFVNLYGCTIGDRSRIGTFVEIQRGVSIGQNVKISSHTFICTGVTIEDDVFIGHNVSFINDRRPFAVRDNEPSRQDDHEVIPTVVRRGAAIGTGAVIMCGITVGEQATVGAGSVVTRDVPPGAVVAGVPAKALKQRLTKTETKC